MKSLAILGLLCLATICHAAPPKVRMAQVGAAQSASPQEMLNAVNAIRAKPRKCGKTMMPAVAPLKWNAILAHSASKHAQDMAQHHFYKHKNKQGLDPFDRHKRDGYQGWGGVENITAGNENLQDTLSHLLESEYHCKTIMNQYITEIGMAQVFVPQSQYGNYWVQNFGIDPDRFYQLKGYPVEKAKRLPFGSMFK